MWSTSKCQNRSDLKVHAFTLTVSKVTLFFFYNFCITSYFKNISIYVVGIFAQFLPENVYCSQMLYSISCFLRAAVASEFSLSDDRSPHTL